MTILVGTASWTDPTLIRCKRFYPPDTSSAEARLRFYATRFPLVEVDSSFYAMPTAANSTLWTERTPQNFVFNMKAFRLFTGHHTALSALPKDMQSAFINTSSNKLNANKQNLFYRDVPADIRNELWRRFAMALQPLQQAGKFGAVLFQFAPWVINNRAGRAHIADCAERMAGYIMAVELRQQSWFMDTQRAATLAFLRELSVAHVIVDEPQGFANSIPAMWEVTHPKLALVRMHGRNRHAWDNISANASSGRFQYIYPDNELDELAQNIQRIAQQVEKAHAVLNTNYEDQGQHNARRLMRILNMYR
ncbi:MAG TPA: DUF72 domain-containing protein [Rhodocyclaceae bacterium]|nr:DUF72 domain-containing protein [Rhodocyclaceae bacterium]